MKAETGKGKPEVFAFSDYRAFLNAYYRDKKAETGTFSVRSWCKRLKVKSPATLNMILRGHRHPGDEVLEKFIEYFNFTPEERDYFDHLVRLAKHKGSEERRIDLLSKLKELHPQKRISLLDFDLFSAMSNWYFFAIREMVMLPDFREDYDWIAKKLGGKIGAKESKDAVEGLISIGMLDRDESGKLRQCEQHVTTPFEIPNEAVKRFHEQMMDLSKRAIREVEVGDREVSGTTFNIKKEDLPLIKAEVRRMREALYRKFESMDGNATYQINVQFFPLTIDKVDISGVETPAEGVAPC